MKLVYFYNEEWEKEYITSRLPHWEVIFLEGSIQDHPEYRDPEALALAVFVNSKIGAEELDRFPKLRFIAARSTGFDHIDLVESGKRNVVVSNVPTYGENTVAEFAFALLLTLSRKIYTAYKNIEINHSFSTQGLTGFDLKGKTIGIVGTGHIGMNMIRMAKGFEMNVIAFDIFPKNDAAQGLGFEYVSFDEILSRADILSLHAPYNEHTHHMIHRGNVEKIKRGAWLVNTARGGLVETDALVYALEKGILAGVGLDVLEEEKNTSDESALILGDHPMAEELKLVLANHYLIWHPNVIITPHNAFNTREAVMRILDTSVKNLSAFMAGNPENVVAKK